MKQKITSEQRALIDQLLDRGQDRDTIAQLASVTPGQVSAVAAHRTMRKAARPVSSHETVSAAESASAESTELINSADHDPSAQPVAIPLGTDKDTNLPVIWDPYASSNPHVLIVGESGSGKTYTASRLVIDLAHAHLPSIVFDYGQGFSLEHAPRAFRDDIRTVELQLGRDGIAINPLQIFPVDTHGPATVAQRVADTFIRVYPRLGVQQHALLRRAVLELLAETGITPENPRTWTLPPPSFRDLEQKLAEYAHADDAATRRAASSAGPHVSTLFFFNTFRKTGHALSWSDLLTRRNEIWILQLGGLEASVERAVTEFLLWSLIRYFEVLGPGPLRCFVVLDEAHKLAFGPGSPVEKILREGRKFGLGVILASQQPEDFSAVAFTNTATKIVFQISDQSGNVSRQLHRKVKNGHSYDYIAKTLGTLPRGSAYVVMANAGRVTRLLSFEERKAWSDTEGLPSAHKDAK
jgi:DNA phosphorothioation-dependent restriction protein DptH